MDNFLVDDYPLIVLPSLAEKIGLNEAIVLQQIHFWLKKKKNYKDGSYWVYNTYEDWTEQFPFWSISTIRRTITSLEEKELLVKGNYNKLKFDKTNWYTIDYEKVKSLNKPSVQNEQTISSDWTNGATQVEQTNNHRLPEITSESSNAYAFYEKNFGMISPFVAEKIGHWIDDLSEDLVLEAMKISVTANKRFNYTEGILRTWKSKNIKSLDDLKEKPKPKKKQQADWSDF